MKLKPAFPFSILLLLAAVAVFTGSRLFLLLAVMTALIAVGGIAGVLWASSTLEAEGDLDGQIVRRGEDLVLSVRMRHRGLIPVAPLKLEIGDPAAARGREIRLRNAPRRLQSLRLPVHAAHVGVLQVGLKSCTVEDLLGIASRTVRLPSTSFELLVLPQTFGTEPIRLAPGDPGSELMARATEDLNAPSDVRSYQPGDAMKKIHWKLSLRKGELIVRRFDEPILQDVLVLLDCSPPPSLGSPRAEADMRDALIETAASVIKEQSASEHQFRLPLTGSHPVEIDSSMGLPMAFDYLARVDFSAAERFERELSIESRRLRKVGGVIVISSRLTIPMVDIMIRMHRVGPTIRFYLVSFAPEDEAFTPLTGRLEQSGIEVASVSPEPV